MRANHNSDSYRIQLFIVWVGVELATLELIGFSETVAERVFCIGRWTGLWPLDRTARSETDDNRKDQCRQRDNPGCFTAYEYMNRHQHHRHEPGNDEHIGHSVRSRSGGTYPALSLRDSR
jgi:hypothetical protein